MSNSLSDEQPPLEMSTEMETTNTDEMDMSNPNNTETDLKGKKPFQNFFGPGATAPGPADFAGVFGKQSPIPEAPQQPIDEDMNDFSYSRKMANFKMSAPFSPAPLPNLLQHFVPKVFGGGGEHARLEAYLAANEGTLKVKRPARTKMTDSQKKDNKIGELMNEVKELNKANEDLTELVETNDVEIDGYKATIGYLRKRIENVEGQCHTLEESITDKSADGNIKQGEGAAKDVPPPIDERAGAIRASLRTAFEKKIRRLEFQIESLQKENTDRKDLEDKLAIYKEDCAMKDKHIREDDDDIAEMQDQIDKKDKILTQNDTTIKQLQKEVALYLQMCKDKTEVKEDEKDQIIARLEQEIAARDSSSSAENVMIAHQQEEIKVKDQTISEAFLRVCLVEEKCADKDKWIGTLKEEISNKTVQLVEKFKAIEVLEDAIKNKDEILRRLEPEFHAKDVLIAEKEAAITKFGEKMERMKQLAFKNHSAILVSTREKHKVKNDESQAIINNLRQEMAIQNGLIEERNAEIERLQKESAEAGLVINRLEQRGAEMSAIIGHQENQTSGEALAINHSEIQSKDSGLIKEKDATISRLEDEAASREKLVSEKDLTIRQLRTQISQDLVSEKVATIQNLKEEMSVKDKLVSEKDLTIRQLQTQISQDLVSENVATIQNLKEEMSVKDKLVSEKDFTIEQYQRHVSAFDNVVREKDLTIEELQKRVSAGVDVVSEKETIIQGLGKEIAIKDTLIGEKDLAIDRFQKSTVGKEQAIGQLQTTVNEKASEIDRLEKKVISKERLLTDYESTISRLEQDLGLAKQSLETEAQKSKDLEAAIRESKNEAQALDESNKAREKEYSVLSEKLEQLRKKLQSATEEQEILRGLEAAAKAQCDQVIKKATQTFEDQKKQVDQANAKARSAEYREKVALSQLELQEFMDRDARKVDNELAAQKIKNQTLQQRIEALSKELKDAEERMQRPMNDTSSISSGKSRATTSLEPSLENLADRGASSESDQSENEDEDADLTITATDALGKDSLLSTTGSKSSVSIKPTDTKSSVDATKPKIDEQAGAFVGTSHTMVEDPESISGLNPKSLFINAFSRQPSSLFSVSSLLSALPFIFLICYAIATVWLAHQERSIWLAANGETRSHVVSLLSSYKESSVEFTSWLFPPSAQGDLQRNFWVLMIHLGIPLRSLPLGG